MVDRQPLEWPLEINTKAHFSLGMYRRRVPKVINPPVPFRSSARNASPASIRAATLRDEFSIPNLSVEKGYRFLIVGVSQLPKRLPRPGPTGHPDDPVHVQEERRL
jgi:hypothetical protein